MANILVVGAGVVGQTTGKGLLRQGNDITFVDISDSKLNELRAEGFTVTPPEAMSFDGIDAVFVSVPTPTGEHGINLGFVAQAANSIGKALVQRSDNGHTAIALRSTVPPGTTRGYFIPLLQEAAGESMDSSFGVSYNPEYLREHSSEKDFEQPRLIVIGGCSEGADQTSRIMYDLYRPFNAPIFTCSYEEAELAKYTNNLFNAAKISFFNEIRTVAEKLGINPTLAFKLTTISAEAVWNPQYGTQDKGPYAGACLPKDIAAWLKFAEEIEASASIVKAVQEVNMHHGGD
jgi:UDPglucose 6-dehydrogenase